MAQQKGVIEFGTKLARNIADFIFTSSQENLIADGKVDTSNLLLSGSIEQKAKEIIIRYEAAYAKAIDEGSKPHFVSSKVLEGWVRRKINPGSEKEVRKIAFLIARAISKRGTVPSFFMTRAIEQARIKFKF
ncbi:MAG TPA: hypothetical protein ENI23_08980 [bacterium]|nr:hypothetical protein [bacterium]